MEGCNDLLQTFRFPARQRHSCLGAPMNKLTPLVAALAIACSSDSTAPQSTPQFPRAFTSLSTSCIELLGFQQVGPDLFVQLTELFLTEASTEVLFAGNASLLFSDTLNTAGELVGEENRGIYLPSAIDGTWEVPFTDGPEVDSFVATGSGTGDLSARSIDFDMEPLSEGCGFITSGTIR